MPPPGQRIEQLNADDLARIVKQRAVIERHLGGDAENLRKYRFAAGKLGLLRALLEQRTFQPTQTYELQCMGIVLGDALVQQCGSEWRAVEDEHGRDPCIQVPGTTIILFPLTMISKRVERGEQVDVFSLFNQSEAKIAELKRIADSEAGQTSGNS
jgi:Domain of unknown function (DUF3806)